MSTCSASPNCRSLDSKGEERIMGVIGRRSGNQNIYTVCKEQHNGKWKWLWSQCDCDYDGENPIRHSVKSFLLRGHGQLGLHWSPLMEIILNLSFLSMQFNSQKQSVKTLIFSSRFNSLIWKEVLSLQFIWNKVGSGILQIKLSSRN